MTGRRDADAKRCVDFVGDALDQAPKRSHFLGLDQLPLGITEIGDGVIEVVIGFAQGGFGPGTMVFGLPDQQQHDAAGHQEQHHDARRLPLDGMRGCRQCDAIGQGDQVPAGAWY